MEPNGNLVLYDGNGAVAWQSTDYIADILPLGHNFTDMYSGNATAIWQEGSLMVNASSTKRLCQLWTGGVKAQLHKDGLYSYNSSDLPTDFRWQVSIDALIKGAYANTSYVFMRFQEDGSFIVYKYEKGTWTWHPACCSGKNNSTTLTPYYDNSIAFVNCLEARWKTILVTCLILGLVIPMICLQLLWIFKRTSRLDSLLLLIIICSTFATVIALARLPSLLLHQRYWYYIDMYYYYDWYSYVRPTKFTAAALAIDLVTLQATTIFLLKFLRRNPNSPKVIKVLVILHMAAILLSYVTVVAQQQPDNQQAIYVAEIFSWGSFFLYPFSIINTICLIIIKLPGRKHCNRTARICLVFFVNIFTAFAFISISVQLVSHYFQTGIIITFSGLTLILMFTSIWAYFSHHIISDAVKMQSIRLSIQIIKRVFLWLFLRRRADDSPDITVSLSSFSYPELEAITSNFSKMLGKGGFGGVYEGTLLDGKKVAVKKLESHSQGMQEFKTEIETLGRMHHVNLVELLGFCVESPYKLLVYEFMSNSSLEKWIFSDDVFLSWTKRMRILLGTARGLSYLHQECQPKILHLDVKPQNILLDESFNAKVSDFGLCRLMPGDQTSMFITKMMGTFGYLAPEWINGSVSEKNDVYSFGIVMLEVLSGHRSYATVALEEESPHFSEWAKESIQNGTLIDPRLLIQEDYNEEEGRRATEVALLCTCEDANMRPSMKRVVKMLEGVDDVFNQQGYRHANEENNLCSIDEGDV